MQWGAARAALEKARAAGKPTPLDSQPQLDQWTIFYWQAFAELSTCRNIGMGVGPIPWTATNAYAERAGIVDPDDFEVFAGIIAALDAAYLEAVSEREKKKKPEAKGVENKPQRR